MLQAMRNSQMLSTKSSYTFQVDRCQDLEHRRIPISRQRFSSGEQPRELIATFQVTGGSHIFTPSAFSVHVFFGLEGAISGHISK